MDHFSYNFDNQQAFDYVAQFMFDQNARAIQSYYMSESISVCMYRTKDGKKCAWGCLLPDEAVRVNQDPNKYSPEDSFQFEGSWARQTAIDKYTPKLTYDFVRGLQSAHDNAHDEHFRATFYIRMVLVAKDCNLDITKLNEIYKDYLVEVEELNSNILNIPTI